MDFWQDDDLEIIHEQLTDMYGAITFEAFINLLVNLSKSQKACSVAASS